MSTDRDKQQQLIDIMFEIVIRMQMGDFKFETRDEAGEFVQRQLKHAGFEVVPMGMSWGVLQK